LKNALILIVLVVALVPAGVAALAQGTPSQPAAAPPLPQLLLTPKPSVLMAMRLISPQTALPLSKYLSLSDAQKTQVTDLLTKAEAAVIPKIEAQRKATQEFVEAMADGSATEAALTAAADRAYKAELAVVAEKIKTLVQLRALFSEQQKMDFNKYVEDRTVPWRMEGARPPSVPPAREPKPAQGPK
jgi:Spy/CpxP family protein refolding chaperone